MRTDYEKLGVWIQAITLASVVVGAALVLMELRQSHSLARAQFSGEVGTLINERRYAVFGEALSETLEKACFKTAPMSRRDNLLLNEYFSSIMMVANRYKTGAILGGFETDWRRLSRGPLMIISGYPQGKRWLEAHPLNKTDPGLSAVIQKVIAEPSQFPCDWFVESLAEEPGD